MHSILQILLIFSSSEGYRLQFSIPCAYFVYTLWHCTGQHCSSMYECACRLFAGRWHPLTSVITTLLCCNDYFSSLSVVSCTFSALSMYSKFGHHLYLCAKFYFFCDLHCCASRWRKIAYSITHPAYLMPREPKLALQNR